jgi:hypothetical protein
MPVVPCIAMSDEIVGRLSPCGFERHLRIIKGHSIEQMHLKNYTQHLSNADLVVDYEDAWMRLKRIFHLPTLIMVRDGPAHGTGLLWRSGGRFRHGRTSTSKSSEPALAYLSLRLKIS